MIWNTEGKKSISYSILEDGKISYENILNNTVSGMLCICIQNTHTCICAVHTFPYGNPTVSMAHTIFEQYTMYKYKYIYSSIYCVRCFWSDAAAIASAVVRCGCNIWSVESFPLRAHNAQCATCCVCICASLCTNMLGVWWKEASKRNRQREREREKNTK